MPGGHDIHRSDLALFVARGLTLPHRYVAPQCGDAASTLHWVRVLDADGAPVSGFAIETSSSRALPGTLIGRADRIGRKLHEATMPYLGQLLAESAKAIPKLQRLDVRVFDENADRRRGMEVAILAAGGSVSEKPMQYSQTIAVDLGQSGECWRSSMTKEARYELRKFWRMGMAQVRIIADLRYARRMQSLYAKTFDRTGGNVPSLDMAALLSRCANDPGSKLVGVFLEGYPSPDDLVAFMLGHFHGDHGSYEEGASDRAEALRQIPMGYPLMAALLEWTESLGGKWFDMGGVPSEAARRHGSLRGIVEFKRRFSRKEIDVATEFVFFPRPFLAFAANASRAIVQAVGR